MKICSGEHKGETICIMEFEDEQELIVRHGKDVLYIEPIFDREGNPVCLSFTR